MYNWFLKTGHELGLVSDASVLSHELAGHAEYAKQASRTIAKTNRALSRPIQRSSRELEREKKPLLKKRGELERVLEILTQSGSSQRQLDPYIEALFEVERKLGRLNNRQRTLEKREASVEDTIDVWHHQNHQRTQYRTQSSLMKASGGAQGIERMQIAIEMQNEALQSSVEACGIGGNDSDDDGSDSGGGSRAKLEEFKQGFYMRAQLSECPSVHQNENAFSPAALHRGNEVERIADLSK